MKRKLQLTKETLRTLSSEDLQQVAGGSSYDACDAPMVMGRPGPDTTRPYPMGVLQPVAVV